MVMDGWAKVGVSSDTGPASGPRTRLSADCIPATSGDGGWSTVLRPSVLQTQAGAVVHQSDLTAPRYDAPS
jgi:hypothetical protein